MWVRETRANSESPEAAMRARLCVFVYLLCVYVNERRICEIWWEEFHIIGQRNWSWFSQCVREKGEANGSRTKAQYWAATTLCAYIQAWLVTASTGWVLTYMRKKKKNVYFRPFKKHNQINGWFVHVNRKVIIFIKTNHPLWENVVTTSRP